MTNLNDGQTSPEPTGSSANQTNQLHAASQASTPSGAETAPNAENSKAQKPESAANSPNLQNGQSAVSLAARGKRIGASAVLPGESGDKYFNGLASTIDELGAKTMTQAIMITHARAFSACALLTHSNRTAYARTVLATLNLAQLIHACHLLEPGEPQSKLPGVTSVLKHNSYHAH